MVLGKGVNSSCIFQYEKSAKCSGYQKKESYLNEKEKNSYKDQVKSQNDKNYGAWGPVYKNRQNFNDMHIC